MTRPAFLPALLLSALATSACRPEPPDPPQSDDREAKAEAEAPSTPQVDAAAMMESIEWLARDELQGRFTLDPEIEEVAEWLGDHYEELGLRTAGGAEDMRVAYSLRTKVEAGEDQTLVVHGKRRATAVDPEQFTPRAEGASAAAKGEVVFVGYAARWDKSEVDLEQLPEGVEPPKLEAYDDLEGVELDGKIALVLAHAPNTPDLMALFSRLQDILREFEDQAKPLREADELAKLAKLHEQAREDIVDLVDGFVDTKELGDEFWKVEDPKAELELMGLLAPLMRLSASRPQFDPAAHTLSKKLDRLVEAGAAGVIVVKGPRSFLGDEARKADELAGVLASASPFGGGSSQRIIPEPAPIPVVQLRWKQADKLLRVEGKTLSKLQAAIDGDYQPRSAATGVEVEIATQLVDERVEVPNVVAVLPGKSDELVVLGAHFDHIGNDETGMCRAIVRRNKDNDSICNGADDNASGTAMLMEIARAYREAGVTPERTLVFAHFSGEELGLLGSKALAGEAPFDMDKVAAMVNLDMVGRLGPRGLAIGGIHSSEQWMPLLDELGNYGMKILYEGATTTRSDHAWWFRRQVPVLFFFTGIHPDYHRAGDEVEEINVEGLGQIGQLVSDLVWELGQGYELSWGGLEPGEGIGRGLPGTNPETVVKRVGKDGAIVEDDAG